MQGELPASRSAEDEAVVRQQIRSLHRAVEEAAAEMARREAVRRRPAGSVNLFDDALYDAPRPQTSVPYAEGVGKTHERSAPILLHAVVDTCTQSNC